MANNHRCGGCGRRDSNNSYGCLNCLGERRRWDNYPFYGGPCPDVDGEYDPCRDEDGGRRHGGCGRREGRCRREKFGIFTATLPVSVAANGILPLVNNNCLGGLGDFPVNSGMITMEEEGTYLATYSVRLPEGAAMATTVTLNVNDASQSSAITLVGGEGPACFTAQAIFDVCDRSTVALRSSEPINITETSAQPLVTLTLVKI